MSVRLGKKLLEKKFPDGPTIVHQLPFMASAIAMVDDDRQLVVAEDGLYIRDASTGALGLHTPLGVLGVFAARVVEELAKVVIFSRRTRQVRWEALARPTRTAQAGSPRPAGEVDELIELA